MDYKAREIALIKMKIHSYRQLESELNAALTHIRYSHNSACELYSPTLEPGVIACLASCAGKIEAQRLMVSGQVRWHEEKLRALQPVAPVEVEGSGP